MEGHRARRVAELLREELSELIGYEMSDPRVGMASVTEVLITPDMRRAQVRLSLGGEPEEQQETLLALEGARNFLRRQLAIRLQLYRVPELHFEADAALGAGDRLESLLKRVRRGRPKDGEEPEKKPAE